MRTQRSGTWRRRAPPPLLALTASVRLAAQSLSVTSFGYDANGNMLVKAGDAGTVTYTWDAENRLVQVAGSTGVETYTYDASTSVGGKVTGLRRRKETDTSTTHFLWDQHNVLAELDANLDTTASYTDFPGFWGGLSSRRTGAGSAFFAGDLSTNVRALLDTSGATAGWSPRGSTWRPSCST